MRLRKPIVLFFFLVSLCTTGFSQVNLPKSSILRAKQRTIIRPSTGRTNQIDVLYAQTLQKMFEVSGSQKSYQSTMKQLFNLFKKQYTGIAESKILNDLEREFNRTSLNDLAKKLVPIYKKHLTIKDLQDVIKFYESPAGQKFAQKTPLILQESVQIGRDWGLQISREFHKRLKKEEEAKEKEKAANE